MTILLAFFYSRVLMHHLKYIKIFYICFLTPHKLKTTGFLLLLFLFNMLLFAQQQPRYVFNRYGKMNGLAANIAYSVTQDKEGFIWIATANGLQRYDGSRFITFRHNPADPGTIPFNNVLTLLSDKKGRLWVRSGGTHIGIFDTHKFRYTPVRIDLPDSVRNRDILRIREDFDGNLQIIVNRYGIITYNEKAGKFSAEYNMVKLPNGQVAGEISKDPATGHYWVSRKEGFDLYNPEKEKIEPRAKYPVLQKLNETLIREKALGPVDPFTDTKGRFWTQIWSGTQNGPDICSYNPASQTWTSYKNNIDKISKRYHEISGYLLQRNGTLWIFGTALFARFNETTNAFEDVRNESLREQGIAVEQINNLYEDTENNIWVSSSNGLYLFNPTNQVFTNLPNRRNDNTPYSHSANAVLQLKNGNIYASAWGAGLFTYDSNFNVIPNPVIPENEKNTGTAIWDMLERENGDIWFGLQGGSIRVFNQHTGKTTSLPLPVFENHTVRQFAEDSSGNIWIGTQGGLVIKCTGGNWRTASASFKTVQRLTGNIQKIMTDRNGFIWVGTDIFGLFKLDPSDGRILQHFDETGAVNQCLRTAAVTDIRQYNDSLLLIASGCLNILNTRTNSFSYIGTNEGIPPSIVYTILDDKAGHLWLGMSTGVCRLSLKESFFAIEFGQEDGITNDRCQVNAARLLRDGRVVFGTTTDLLVGDPKKISIYPRTTPVSIASFKVFNKLLPLDSLLQLQEINLPYTSNSITIELTTHTYTHRFGILYMLEGVDKEWQLTANKEINYNYLSPGKYTFKTKIVVADNTEPEKITTLQIHIDPPFWKRWWFYSVLILSGIGILYLIDQERIKRIKENQELRTDISLNLHKDVNTALSNINLLSERARMKADKDITQSKQLIEMISEKSNDMIIAMDDMLWGIDPANDSMEKMAQRLTEFTDSLRNQYAADITILADDRVRKLKIEMKIRHGIYIIYKEALRCIVQHASGTNTLINIDLIKNNISLKMKDSTAVHGNESISRYKENIQMHANEINAKFDMQYDNTGISIVLLVPVK